MYKLEYLPAARKDMVEAAAYVSRTLGNAAAAERLAMELIQAAERIQQFPYAHPAYRPIRALRREYRKCLAGNYLLFYWVEEEKKLITIARVIYAKRNYDFLLE